jgi:metallo-beta-lactamase family protein
MRLSFHGADRTVTGSCHMVECAGQRVLVDCGMIQGSRDLEEENAADLGFDPRSIGLGGGLARIEGVKREDIHASRRAND